MTGVFLQARLDSSRLPGKALVVLGSRTILGHAMARLQNVNAEVHVLTCDEASADVFRPMARRYGFALYAGSRNDVLSRFIGALERFPVDTVVRATADNPFVSWEYAERTLRVHAETKADYTTFVGMPVGTGVEVVQAEALRRAHRESRNPYDHEHVTPYVYRSGLFHLERPVADVDPALGTAHVTLDTRADFQHLVRMLENAGDAEDLDFNRLCEILLTGASGGEP